MSNCGPSDHEPSNCELEEGRRVGRESDWISSPLEGAYGAPESSKDGEVKAHLEDLVSSYRRAQEQLTTWSCLFNVEFDGKKVNKERYKTQVRQSLFDTSYNPTWPNFGAFFRHTNLWSVMVRSTCYVLQILWIVFAYCGKRWLDWETETAGGTSNFDLTLISFPYTMMFAFYLSYVVQRYYREYFAVRTIEGRLNDLVITWTGVVQKAPACKMHVENFCRYLHASTLAGFLSIGQYFQTGFALDLMAQIGLLSQDDVRFLAGSAGRNPGRLLSSRALQVLQDMEANGWVSQILHSRLLEVVYEHRRNMADVRDTEDKPIPFGYYMLVNSAAQIFMFMTTLTYTDAGYVRPGQVLLMITFISLAQILVNHMGRPLGWGPTCIDVIGITLERWWEQLKYLNDLAELPPLSARLPKVQCKSTLYAVSGLMNTHSVGEGSLSENGECTSTGEGNCECVGVTVIENLAVDVPLQEGKSLTQDTDQELNDTKPVPSMQTVAEIENPLHNLQYHPI